MGNPLLRSSWRPGRRRQRMEKAVPTCDRRHRRGGFAKANMEERWEGRKSKVAGGRGSRCRGRQKENEFRDVYFNGARRREREKSKRGKG